MAPRKQRSDSMSSGYSSSASPLDPGGGGPSGTGQDGAEVKEEWNMDEEDWDPSLPKPRPGEVVTKRTLQNRKAQREFRKRREARVKDLEERCRRFDQMGLEANVELQRFARKMKEENDTLKSLVSKLGYAHLISEALAGGEITVAEGNILATTPTGMEYVLGGQKQVVGKVGGRASQQIARMQQQQASAKRKEEEAARALQPRMNAVTVPVVSATQPAFDVQAAMHGNAVDPNMLHQAATFTAPGSSADGGAGPSAWMTASAGNAVSNAASSSLSGMVASGESGTSASGEDKSSNQLLRLNLSKMHEKRSGVDPSQNIRSNQHPPSMQIVNSVDVKPERGPAHGAGLSGSAMLHSDARFDTNHPVGQDPSSSNLEARPTFTFPMPHSTHTSDALLNPNPIPFAFNLSSTNPSNDQRSWWQQLQLGGAILPPRTTEEGDDVLDEKAAIFAEAQRQKQAQLQGDIGRPLQPQAHTTHPGQNTTPGGTNTTPGGGAQSPFDLNMFLSGGFTPGGGFVLGGPGSASGSLTEHSGLTPGIMQGSGQESSMSWPHQNGSSPAPLTQRSPRYTMPDQEMQRQRSQPSLPQTEHAQMFLSLLERKLAANTHGRDYEQLGFQPPMIARGAQNDYQPTAGTSRPSMKRKASSAGDDGAHPHQRRPLQNSHSTGHIFMDSRQQPDAGSLTPGSIYSRLSQHPAFLSTNMYELEELVETMGDYFPTTKAPETGSEFGGIDESPRASTSQLGMTDGQQHPRVDAMHRQHSHSSTGSAQSSNRKESSEMDPTCGLNDHAVDRVFGLLDRKYAGDAARSNISSQQFQQRRSPAASNQPKLPPATKRRMSNLQTQSPTPSSSSSSSASRRPQPQTGLERIHLERR